MIITAAMVMGRVSHVDVGEAAHQQSANNQLLDVIERLSAHQLSLRPGSATGDWLLNLNACDEICPWVFAFGHRNYARWVSVFLRDMARLPDIHPSVHKAFMAGNFVMQRGDKKSSLMAFDQNQEHSIQFLPFDLSTQSMHVVIQFFCHLVIVSQLDKILFNVLLKH